MKIINLKNFRKMSAQEIDAAQPISLLYDEAPRWVVAKATDVIVIGDLNPAVQIQFRAREQLARSGMPKPEVFVPEGRIMADFLAEKEAELKAKEAETAKES